MALTRPRLGQLNTSVVAQSDPITVLNQGASLANVDVGFLFNRANGLVSNVALYWSESAQSIVTAYTSSTGTTNSNISVTSYANLTVGNVLLVTGSILNVQGNIAANTTGILYGNVNSSGNISTSGNVYASSFFYANGSPFVSSYGNVQMLANLAAVSNPVAFGGNIITGNILPSANVTYDIGSPTLRFRTLYISGTTIDMGGAQITTDSASGGFAFVPKPTTANPNPLGTVFSPTGGITTINTTGGIVAAGAINTSINSNQGTTNFGNVRVNSDTSSTSTTTGALVVAGGAGIAGNVFAGNVLATGFFYANGTPFVSSSYGNTDVASYLPTYTGSLAASTDITALYANAGAQSNSIAGANTAIVTANTAIKSYVDAQITNLTNGAPALLDTLGEIATSLGNNASLSTTLLNSIAGSNAAIITANTALKSYVDTQDSAITTAWTSNAGAQANQIAGANAVVATLQANVGSFYTYANATFSYGNANVAANLATFGSNPILTTGNVTAGNLITSGVISAGGAITAPQAGSIIPFYFANTAVFPSAATYHGAVAHSHADGKMYFAHGSNWVELVDVSSTQTLTNKTVSGVSATMTANVSGGNIVTTGQVSATGNITGNFFVGNGSLLTGIAAGGYGNANVAANLAAFGSNPVSTTGNVTAGNFIGNVVGGGAGTPTISSTTNLDLSAVSAVRVIGGGTFRLPTLTTAQIANIIAANGDMVYNSTTTKIQAYANSAWGNITLT